MLRLCWGLLPAHCPNTGRLPAALSRSLLRHPPNTPAPGAEWLEGGALQKVVLVITGVASKEVLERWTFDIQTDKAVVAGRWVLPCQRTGWCGEAQQAWPACWLVRRAAGRQVCCTHASCESRCLHHHTHCACLPARHLLHSAPLPEKSEAQITQEIQAIIRQITASVTFLPLLSDQCEHGWVLACPPAAATAAMAGRCT